jgi:hypothetical protein
MAVVMAVLMVAYWAEMMAFLLVAMLDLLISPKCIGICVFVVRISVRKKKLQYIYNTERKRNEQEPRRKKK